MQFFGMFYSVGCSIKVDVFILGEIITSNFLYYPFTKYVSLSDLVCQENGLSEIGGLFGLFLLYLGFPLKSFFNMTTNPSGPIHLYTKSKWQCSWPDEAIFFAILSVIMWDSLVVR